MTDSPLTQDAKIKRGAEDSGKYFRYMAEFVGLTQNDAELIRRYKPLIAKHMPAITGAFYSHLLRYPPTRKYFIKPDGSIDQDYLELRMRHLTNFWLRTADGVFDDDYARYVDYVGRAHTSRGADPHIYIAERYVIGQVGFMQHAISQAISQELGYDQELSHRVETAWDKLMMVILELLARAYGHEREAETYDPLHEVNSGAVGMLAEHAFDHELGVAHRSSFKEVVVCKEEEIPDGERKLIDLEGLSIGVFHHKGQWVALRNSCLHRGGPVATGNLEGDTLTCPWHGFQYNVMSGALLADPSAKLERYPVTIERGQVILLVPDQADPSVHHFGLNDAQAAPPPQPEPAVLKENEFRPADLNPGQMQAVRVDGLRVAVYNVDGSYYATQADCTHAGGPLEKGDLVDCIVTCPWHGSRFEVSDGSVVEGPAKKALQTLKVTLEGEIGRVEFA